jgi:hypothetical protein
MARLFQPLAKLGSHLEQQNDGEGSKNEWINTETEIM